MKFLKTTYSVVIAMSAIVLMQACKAKKIVQNAPTPVAEVVTPAPAPVAKPAPVAEAVKPAPVPVKPDYNFSNIQFEFNSGILKTDSYAIMDKAAAAMKQDPSVKFVLNGNASAEGTAAHNMALSVERATAVKTYLVNTGVSADNLTTKGYGDTKPLADNNTEAGRIKNRRVEIQKL